MSFCLVRPGVVLALGLAAALAVSSAARAADTVTGGTETALLSPSDGGPDGAIQLPTILSDTDVARYQRIFKLQETGRWKKANREARRRWPTGG